MTPRGQLRVIGYARVSQTAGRDGERFISPEVQRETVERFVAGKGHELVDFLVDLDSSGGALTRPKLEEILARLESGQADAIAVPYLSRLSRRVLDGLGIVQRLHGRNQHVLVADLDLDTSTPVGRTVLTVLLSFAELELEQRRESWAVAQRKAMSRGIYPGSTPLGYARDEDGRMVPDVERAPAIRRVFEQRAKGMSWAGLARQLDMEMPREDGRTWRSSTVADMVTTPLYLGRLERTVDGELLVVDGAHEPLVDRALWEAVNAVSVGARAPTRRPEPALLAGLLRCAGCHGPMSRGSGGRKRAADGSVVSYDAYVCLSRCDKQAKMSVPTLNQFVVGETLERLAASAAVDGTRSRSDEIGEWRREVSVRERELEAYLAAISVADVGEAAFAQGARTRREALDAARRFLAEAELRVRRVGRSHRDLIDWLPGAADGEGNAVLRTLVREIRVEKSGRAGRVGNAAERVRISWLGDDESMEHPPAVVEHAGRKRQPIAA